MTRGNMVMLLEMQMVSLSKDAARKIYDQVRLVWMASPPDKPFHFYPLL
jgi:hypothetical protein